MSETDLTCWETARGDMKCAPLDQAPPWVQEYFPSNEGSYHNGVTNPSQGQFQEPPIEVPWYIELKNTVFGWFDTIVSSDVGIVIVALIAIAVLLPVIVYVSDLLHKWALWNDSAADSNVVGDYIKSLNATHGSTSSDNSGYDDYDSYYEEDDQSYS